MKRGARILVPVIVAILLIVIFTWLVQGKQIDVLQPAGVVAEEQRQILVFALLLSAVVVTPVFTLLVMFSVKYRASNKNANYDPDFGENKLLEGLWWAIPITIIGVLGVLTYQTSHSLDPYKKIEGSKPLNVQVVGLQWKWLFIYPEYDIATLNYVAMPVNRPVHFSLTTEAPMSALWIPALGSQIYAMNGMDSQLNLKGTKIGEYTGYNTNINGEGYAKMTFKAQVMAKNDFKEWRLKASRAATKLDMPQFDKLAEPLVQKEQRDYLLTDDGLYDEIVERNMSHGNMHGEHNL